MQPRALVAKIILLLGCAAFKHAAGLRAELLLPVRYLHRMHVKLLGDLLNCLDALEGLQSYSGLEYGIMSFAFCFHLVCLGLGCLFQPVSTIAS